MVDLSHWDVVDSFEDAKDDGVVGIIHKATESNNYFDPTYNQRKNDALAAGLLWGAYHFLRPRKMKDQAQYFVTKAAKDLGLYAGDHEDEGVSLDDLKTFLREVKRLTGKSPIIYSGHVLKEQLGDRRDSELSQYRLWLAFNTHQVRQAGQKRHSRNGGSGNTQSMVNARAFLATAKAILISINISAPSNN
ncbi:MAG: glycoside hydrolase family 25 protein [Pseudolabrys sp.]